MIWLLLLGCGTSSPIDAPMQREAQLYQSCSKAKDYADCYEYADMVDDASSAAVGLQLACTGEFKDSCKRFVREHHQTDSHWALWIAANHCRDKGELCEDVLKFRDLYPEYKKMYGYIVPIAEAKLAGQGSR